MRAVNLYGYACTSASSSKKVQLHTSKDPCIVVQELVNNAERLYLKIVDLDDHFADVALDFTNPEFD